jgi:hypothetical protein
VKLREGLSRKKFQHGKEQPELEKQYLRVYAEKERRNRKRMKHQLQYTPLWAEDEDDG